MLSNSTGGNSLNIFTVDPLFLTVLTPIALFSTSRVTKELQTSPSQDLSRPREHAIRNGMGRLFGAEGPDLRAHGAKKE